MIPSIKPKFVVLAILDGWGLAPDAPGNAISKANTVNFENKILIAAIEHAKINSSNLHIMGLLGAGGVHSNIEHLFALIRLTSKLKFSNLFLHLFTDGRDSPP